MKILTFISPWSIHHGYSTWKTFWDENFTLTNIKNCGRHNVRKHKDIKDCVKYITLDICLGFVSMGKMRITSSEPK